MENGFQKQPDGSVTMKCPREVEATIFENHDLVGFARLGEVTAAVTVATGAGTDPPAMAAPMIVERLPNGSLGPLR